MNKYDIAVVENATNVCNIKPETALENVVADCMTDYLEMRKAEECKPKTNADKIRSMSDEELAEFFSKRDKIPNTYKCKEVDDWIKWLQFEVE